MSLITVGETIVNMIYMSPSDWMRTQINTVNIIIKPMIPIMVITEVKHPVAQ